MTNLDGRAPGWNPDRVAAGALAALVLALFAPAVLGRRVFFQRDILAYWYPNIETAVRAVAEGGWPTWNPYVAFGRPLMADPNFQLLYPPTWLNLLIRPGAYYTVFVVAHCWTAGLGLYLFSRRAGLSALPAALAGAVWCTSGPLLSAVNLFHHFAGAAWMPWVLWALLRALERETFRSALLLGAVAGAQALAGSADMCLLTALAGALLLAVFLWRGPPPALERSRRIGRALVVAGPFAAALAAAQWLPALALLRGGSRLGQSLSTSGYWSVHPASLADLVVPRLLADPPLDPMLRAVLFEGRAPLLVCLYLGAAAVPLAALGLLTPGRPLRVWAAVAFFLFVLASLGRHTPVYPLLFGLPPWSLLRYPAKYMIPAALFWAVLTGLGLEAWLRPWSAGDRRPAAGAVALGLLTAVAVAALAWWLSVAPAAAASLLAPAAPADPGSAMAVSRWKLWTTVALAGAAALLLAARAWRASPPFWLSSVLCALVLGDLARVGYGVNPLAPPELVRHRPPLATRLAAEGPEVRLYVRNEGAEELNRLLVRGPGGWDSELGWALGAQQMLQPPIASRWRVSGSYDGDFTGMAPRALSTLSVAVAAVAWHPLSVRLLQAGGVTHVASLRERPFPGLEEVEAFPCVFSKPIRLFRVPDPLPRAYLVGGARAAAGEEGLLAALADRGFDPRQEVVLPHAATQPAPTRFSGAARLTRRRLDALEVEVDLSAPGWLVLLEAYERGWTARVDGAPAPVLPANALFLAVPVPAGHHRIELRYRAPLLGAGLFLSLGAGAAGLAFAMQTAGAGRRPH